jgi:hypothetical protein
MRTLVITFSCLVLALLLTSFAPLPWRTTDTVARSGASISTHDLTLSAGALGTPAYADAH